MFYDETVRLRFDEGYSIDNKNTARGKVRSPNPMFRQSQKQSKCSYT